MPSQQSREGAQGGAGRKEVGELGREEEGGEEDSSSAATRNRTFSEVVAERVRSPKVAEESEIVKEKKRKREEEQVRGAGRRRRRHMGSKYQGARASYWGWVGTRITSILQQ